MPNIPYVPYESKFREWNLKFRLIESFDLDTVRIVREAQVRGVNTIAPREQVERYVLQMKGGAEFPPIVLWTGTLIDGNTRVAACRKLGQGTFPAYEVELPNLDMARMLGAALNQLGGQSLRPDEARAAALMSLDAGWTDTQIHREYGVAVATVRGWRMQRQAEERAERLGIGDVLGELSRKKQQQVAKVTHDEPFKLLVEELQRGRPDDRDTKEVVAAVLEATSDDVAVSVIAEAAADWTPIGPDPGSVPPSPAREAKKFLGGLVKHPASHWVDVRHVDDLLPKWEQLAEIAAQVVAEYRRLTSAAVA
jgi:ParB-like chromosome segregation protein Spo0J